MADIFDEIDEELRQDRQAVLWQRYGKYVIAVAGVIIALVGARQGYVYWQDSRDARAATAFYQAAAIDDDGSELRAQADSLTDGYQMLADFSVARKLAGSGDNKAAEAAFLTLAEQADLAPVYRDMALLLSVMHADSGTDITTLLERIEPISASAGPLQGLALEQAAGLELARGRTKEAADRLSLIIGLADAPVSLRQRAARLMAVIAPSDGQSSGG